MPLYNKLKGSRFIGFLSIACSIFVAISGWVCISQLVFSLDYTPSSLKALPQIYNVCCQVAGLLIVGALIGTCISVLLLLLGGFVVLWKPDWQRVLKIGVYLSLASGISMILALLLSAPVRMAINLSVLDVFLGTTISLIFPLIYMTFPAILFILFRKFGTNKGS